MSSAVQVVTSTNEVDVITEGLQGLPGSNGVVFISNLSVLSSLPSATMASGTLAYIGTLRGYYQLDHSANGTADGITILNASGGGQWIRTSISDGSFWQQQAAWFIDPQNVTLAASDENPGTQALPLRTHNELVRRWGTRSPRFTQPPTITFLSSHTDASDPVLLQPTRDALLTYQGTIVQLRTGSLSAVVAKNRSTPQYLNANLGATPVVGTVIHNTTVGKDSYAWVHANLGGNVAEITQPHSRTAVTGFGVANTEVDTWANGDTFEILQFSAINLVFMDPVPSTFPTVPGTGVVFKQMTIFDPAGIFADDCYIGAYVSFTECFVMRSILGVDLKADLLSWFQNCHLAGGAFPLPGSIVIGGAIDNALDTSFSVTLDGDVILSGNLTCHDNVVVALAAISTGSTLQCVGTVGTKAQNYATGALWGNGALNLAERCTYFYTGLAANAFLLKGGITMNTVGTASCVDTSVDPNAWHSGRTITAAHLDATIANGGFAGTAISSQTFSSITNAFIS